MQTFFSAVEQGNNSSVQSGELTIHYIRRPTQLSKELVTLCLIEPRLRLAGTQRPRRRRAFEERNRSDARSGTTNETEPVEIGHGRTSLAPTVHGLNSCNMNRHADASDPEPSAPHGRTCRTRMADSPAFQPLGELPRTT